MEQQQQQQEQVPRDAKVVMAILRSMGVTEYEPRVVNQFLDLCYRYVVEVLGDAQVYCEHAARSAINCDDLRLAVQSRVNLSFCQPPPRETLLELAKIRNSVPLPKVIGGPGIALPPEQETLILPNFQLMVPTRTMLNTEDMDYEQEEQLLRNDGEASSPTAKDAPPADSAARRVAFSLRTVK